VQKTKIEWVKNPDGSQGYSWNPIKGKCPAECKLPDGRIYCYGHGLYNGRLKRIDPGEPRFDSTAFCKGADALERSKPRGVFICSTFDLFHPVTNSRVIEDDDYKDTWRDYIFEIIKQYPRHRFYILTKFPQNIDRELPDNVWLGVSVTEGKDWPRVNALRRQSAAVKFVSFEPLLGDVHVGDSHEDVLRSAPFLDWVIIGRLTGFGHKFDPPFKQLRYMVEHFEKFNTPVFLKNNLSGIWPDELIQEVLG